MKSPNLLWQIRYGIGLGWVFLFMCSRCSPMLHLYIVRKSPYGNDLWSYQQQHLHSLVPNNKLRQRKNSNVADVLKSLWRELHVAYRKNTPHLESVDVNSRRSNNRTPNWNSAQATKKKTTAERTLLWAAKKKPSTRDRKTAVIAVFFLAASVCNSIQFLGMQRDKTPHLRCERSRWREGTTDASRKYRQYAMDSQLKRSGEVVNLEVGSRNSACVLRCNDRQQVLRDL